MTETMLIDHSNCEFCAYSNNSGNCRLKRHGGLALIDTKPMLSDNYLCPIIKCVYDTKVEYFKKLQDTQKIESAVV